ncbi:MAG: tRNA preQ1(34) S-adenosylmethionine ribosyltransferase-isomerase QueA [Firmicutes bacterium]|nr:tRNA preQ1(34) S-adenosylmethionine ribosyltransferase-isomerase QueA [Bacillota bacterium]
MKISTFDYTLPQELIAQSPIANRDMSRLMLLDKKTGEIKHEVFKNIVNYINEGDCVVFNDTRVIPARLFGTKQDTGAKIEFLLLNRKETDVWEVILKPGKRAKAGSRFVFGNGLSATVLDVVNEGNRLVKFEFDGLFENVLEKVGKMPLPPYINKSLDDNERYQTVYSCNNGSAAAPTAGLHFTDELLDSLQKKGVKKVFLTLHVGLGTFRPVKAETVDKHKMHSEYYCIDEAAAQTINETKANGKKVIAVGTTSVRTIESVARQGVVKAGEGQTDIFIYPPYKFQIIDKLITNFHLPKSTLLMLVSALAGRENVLSAYENAIAEKYRFFSFGDAMFIH